MTGAELYVALVAAIDEDELTAARAGDTTCHWEAQYIAPSDVSVGEYLGDEWIGDVAAISGDACGQFTANHIARHGPTRVLRDVVAYRRILELHKPGQPQHDEQGNYVGMADRRCGEHRPTIDRAWCSVCEEWCYPHDPCERCPDPVPEELRILAGIYWIEVP